MKSLEIKLLNKKVIEDKIRLIEQHVQRLKGLQGLSVGHFAVQNNFDIAAWNLRCALESTFDICAHILSRIPGVRAIEYKEMALEMGKQRIVPTDFAENQLYQMAGYRNRLTHFYFEVKPKEMYKIIQNDLGDFETFLKYIKKLLKK
jgi:uncharacterized protein YutE (UPF0331/DUF86 family)